jgi:NTP pyrophosphatase (non-canonical NTP hydrolase)
MTISEFQQRICDIYLERDSARGIHPTFTWFVEEVGELAKELRRDDHKRLEEEFSDVFAWLVSLAAQCGIDLETAAARYASGCPKCRRTPCACP